MKSIDLNTIYATQINNLIQENGLEENFLAEVINCTSINEVFAALSNQAAKHVAILTQHGKPIENMFDYIKEQLAENEPVSLALFFEKDEFETVNS